jgi:hypothetical protein
VVKSKLPRYMHSLGASRYMHGARGINIIVRLSRDGNDLTDGRTDGQTDRQTGRQAGIHFEHY